MMYCTSASADTSGTSRQYPMAAPEGAPLPRPLSMPGPDCQLGIGQTLEIPPPPAPALSFHTFSAGGGPTAVRGVPPTDVTNGCAAGSLTARLCVSPSVRSHPSEPVSPDAANTDIPS